MPTDPQVCRIRLVEVVLFQGEGTGTCGPCSSAWHRPVNRVFDLLSANGFKRTYVQQARALKGETCTK